MAISLRVIGAIRESEKYATKAILLARARKNYLGLSS